MKQIGRMSITDLVKIDKPVVTLLFEMQRERQAEADHPALEHKYVFGVNGCKIDEMGFISIDAVRSNFDDTKAACLAQKILDETLSMYQEKTSSLSIIEDGIEYVY